MADKNLTLAETIGRNVNLLRLELGLTMEQVASAGKSFLGLSWSAGSIGAIEKGRFKPTLDTLLAIATVIPNTKSILEGRASLDYSPPIPLLSLISGSDHIQISPSRMISPDDLVSWMREEGGFKPQFTLAYATHGDLIGSISSISAQPSVAEARIAEKAGINPEDLLRVSSKLWGQGIEARRDALAGPDASAQKKGRITRTLIEEIKHNLGRDNG